jgi:hypothetical protein
MFSRVIRYLLQSVLAVLVVTEVTRAVVPAVLVVQAVPRPLYMQGSQEASSVVLVVLVDKQLTAVELVPQQKVAQPHIGTLVPVQVVQVQTAWVQPAPLLQASLGSLVDQVVAVVVQVLTQVTNAVDPVAAVVVVVLVTVPLEAVALKVTKTLQM